MHIFLKVKTVHLFLFRSFIHCKLLPKFLHQNLEELAADPLPRKMKDSVVRYLCRIIYVRVLLNMAWNLWGKLRSSAGLRLAGNESHPCLVSVYS